MKKTNTVIEDFEALPLRPEQSEPEAEGVSCTSLLGEEDCTVEKCKIQYFLLFSFLDTILHYSSLHYSTVLSYSRLSRQTVP